jgi:tetratricopeptide (TPR) repeat protein
MLMQQRGQSLRRGIDCLERAIELDPRYPAAMAALGESLALLGHYGLVDPRTVMPRARKLLESAVALDPSNADALSALALVTLVWDRDRKGAEAMWQRAIALNPRSAPVRTQYGAWFLGFSEGRFGDADVQLEEALKLDPLSAYVWASASLADWTSFRPSVFGRSEMRARRALELDPDNYLARWTLQMALTAAGRFEEAIVAGNAAMAVSNRHSWALSGIAYAMFKLGRVPEARAIYSELQDRATREFIPLSVPGIIALYLGEVDEGLKLLWRAIEQRETNITTILPTYPFVGNLREMPDYPKMMAAIGWSTA